MPSGPKKRKAAKKKKEKETHNLASINSNTPQGNEDPKSHEERESEGSEVASPVSQDHHKDHNCQHPFDEESEKRASGDAERSNAGQGDGEVEKEPKTVQNAESNGISAKHADSMKVPHYGNDKSSSSSSSDDESQTFTKKEEKTRDAVSNVVSRYYEEKKLDAISEGVPLVSGKGKPPKEAYNNSDVEPSSAINSGMPVVPVPEVVRPVMESIQVESSEFVEFSESTSIENMDKILPVSNGSGVPLGLLSEKSEDRLTLDEKLTFVEVTSAADTSNDVQNAKESETEEFHETMPLVNSAPQIAQRTTWVGIPDVEFSLFAAKAVQTTLLVRRVRLQAMAPAEAADGNLSKVHHRMWLRPGIAGVAPTTP